MKKEIGKYIAIFLGIICIILAIALIYIKVSSVNAQTADKDLRDKIKEEISFLDSNIADVMNKINNITVIKYKVYNREINEEQSNNSSSQSSSGGSNEESQGGSQSQNGQGSSSQEGSSSTSGGQEQGGGSSQNSSSQGQGQSSNQQGSQNGNQGQSQSNSTTVSELVPDVTLENNNEETDWKEIAYSVENLYSTWPTINLDFQKQGISSEIINSFSLSMDGVIQSIKNKDKKNTLINLFNMYINIPKYASSISLDNNTLNLYNTKLNILNAYTLVSTDDNWNNAIASITSAKSYFSSIISTENSDENKKNSLQKTYVLIEDLERISQINDKQIFYMGYKNIMQALETI